MKRIAVVIAMVVLLAVIPASACSDVACLGHGDEMRQGFAVKVTHERKPLAGVVVDVVIGAGSKQFSAPTGADGTVHVGNLPAGDYWLKVKYLGVFAAYQCFHIENHPSGRAKKRLIFEWGNYAPSTHQVAGKFIDSQPGKGGNPLWNMTHRVDMPILGATMKLTDALTGAVHAAVSDNKGEFAFPTLPPGTYVLHVDAGAVGSDRSYDSTDLVIKVSAKAQSNALVLTNREPGAGSCGGISLDVRRTGS